LGFGQRDHGFIVQGLCTDQPSPVSDCCTGALAICQPRAAAISASLCPICRQSVCRAYQATGLVRAKGRTASPSLAQKRMPTPETTRCPRTTRDSWSCLFERLRPQGKHLICQCTCLLPSRTRCRCSLASDRFPSAVYRGVQESGEGLYTQVLLRSNAQIWDRRATEPLKCGGSKQETDPDLASHGCSPSVIL
jgi:hypothetical protein